MTLAMRRAIFERIAKDPSLVSILLRCPAARGHYPATDVSAGS